MIKYALASSVSCADSKSCITYYGACSNIQDRIDTIFIECSGDNLFLPTWMNPGSNDTPHPLMRLNKICIEQRITYPQYKEEVVFHMRGKKGLLRYMNTMIVQGSVNMIISLWKVTNEGYISIPEYIDSNTSILILESGVWNPHTIKYGIYDIIVRQPFLWTGIIYPVRVKLTPADMKYIETWDVNNSMRFPISMCTPFGADYDGY